MKSNNMQLLEFLFIQDYSLEIQPDCYVYLFLFDE